MYPLCTVLFFSTNQQSKPLFSLFFTFEEEREPHAAAGVKDGAVRCVFITVYKGPARQCILFTSLIHQIPFQKKKKNWQQLPLIVNSHLPLQNTRSNKAPTCTSQTHCQNSISSDLSTRHKGSTRAAFLSLRIRVLGCQLTAQPLGCR